VAEAEDAEEKGRKNGQEEEEKGRKNGCGRQSLADAFDASWKWEDAFRRFHVAFPGQQTYSAEETTKMLVERLLTLSGMGLF
jgi:hypothetical protein